MEKWGRYFWWVFVVRLCYVTPYFSMNALNDLSLFHHFKSLSISLSIFENIWIYTPSITNSIFLDNLPRSKEFPNTQNEGKIHFKKVGILSGLLIVVGILSVPIFGWHFVRTISTCFGILSESWKMSPFEWVWVRLCTVSSFPPI